MSRLQLIAIALTSYALAAVSYFVINPPWALVPSALMPVVNGPLGGPVEGSAMVAWCGIAIFAFWRSRWAAWPIVLGAPFALYLPLEVGLMWAICLFAHECI